MEKHSEIHGPDGELIILPESPLEIVRAVNDEYDGGIYMERVKTYLLRFAFTLVFLILILFSVSFVMISRGRDCLGVTVLAAVIAFIIALTSTPPHSS